MNFKSGSFKQRLALGFVFVLIFSYAVYHLSTIFDDNFSTYAAGVTTETDVLNYSGYIFRDEQVLYSEYSGVTDYKVKDGTKVSEKQELATVYELGGGLNKELLRHIDERIEILEESLKTSNVNSDMGELKDSVGDTYNTIVKMLAAKDTGSLSYQTDKLLIGLNGMEAVSRGKEAEAYKTLDSLRTHREAILSEAGDSRTYVAGSSGYFYSAVDGFEDQFSLEDARQLTPTSFFELASRYSERTSEDDTAYGKICYSSEWLFILPIDLSEQSYFTVGEVYSATFDENNNTVIPLTVESIIEAPEYKSALIVLSSDRLPNNFSIDRCQSVSIVVDSVSGIYVPKSVVERVDGFRGVYIMRGNVVHFRYIEIVHEGDDYYLVEADTADSDEHTYLKANDMIILNGKNLFDGRVFD